MVRFWMAFGISGGVFEHPKPPLGTPLIHAMKTYRGSRGITPLILILGARRRRVFDLTPLCFTSGEDTRYPLNRRLGGSVWTVRRIGKNPLPLLEFEPRTGLGYLINIMTKPLGLTPWELYLTFINC